MRRASLQSMLIAVLLLASAAAQVPEFDFYPAYRNWMIKLPVAERRDTPALLERYRQQLVDEGVAPAEIQRRLDLLRTQRDKLEADYWNRFFTTDKGVFNAEPNAFLVSVVEGRKPGRAVDVGAGEGRNAIYLAKLGWDVTAFDPADKALALAQERAGKLGVKIKTVVALDTEFDYGTDQWDLAVFSWTRPSTPQAAAAAIRGLKPGGLVVFEGSRNFFPQMNGALEAFKGLRVLRYEDELSRSDYFNREQMNVIRLLAEKPQ
ncbi:MAG TPA: methyltransferase domain-containing protein [Vicinamibacterales bacterium]